jgi:tetratricopeptide (TPR) repeat protein
MRALDSDRESLFSQAADLHRAGRLPEAISLYQRLLQNFPQEANAHNMLGIALFQSGRLAEAAQSMEAALKLNPLIPNGDFNLANVLQALGRHPEANRHYETVLRRDPNDIPSLQNSAMVLSALGRHEEAAERYRRVLSLDPQVAEANLGLGASLYALGQAEAAIECYGKAVAIRPDYFEAYVNLGNLNTDLKRFENAFDHYRKAAALRPQLPFAHLKLAETLRALGRREEAAANYRSALALDPDNADILTNLGNELRALDRYEEAANYHERAAALMPENADLQRNLGVTYSALEQYDRALQCYDKALAIRPHPEAAAAKGLLCLHAGRFAEGWPLFERRRERKASDFVISHYPAPRWTGARVDGTLLVWGEEGLGDQILYASMIPEVRALAHSVVLELEPRLVKLFARSFPDVDVIPMKPELYGGVIKAHCPIGSLGLYLRSSWDDFPRREQGYLRADRGLASRLRERLVPDGRKLIGLSWRSFHRELAVSKSARLGDFERLMRLPNARFVDLQYGDTRDERANFGRESGIELARAEEIDNTNDIDGLAALIMACDAVVTVSNTTAHVAGALGQPVWLLVPSGQGRLWYWFKDRKDSPWYPGMRIFRQLRGQPWAGLVSSIEDSLSAFLAGRGGVN